MGTGLKQRALIIINPKSGMMRANKFLTEIAEMLVLAGYIPTVLVTTKHGDATDYAKTYGENFDLVIGVGGDGTFNEVVAGVMQSGSKVPIGYIPSGTTNDFANCLGLPGDVVEAARLITQGKPIAFDIGSFNGRIFSYVACFGAFTKASYSTPQSIKNIMGHLAYVLEGIREGLSTLASLKASHMVINADGQIYEGDYIFGAISNSTSLGGILTLKKENVDMHDGLFELMLVKMPKDVLELAEIANLLTTHNMQSEMLTFIRSSKFEIEADKDVDWSLDGEYQEGSEKITIENLHGAVNIVVGDKV